MSYAPPAGGFPAPPVPAPAARDRARALPGLAVLLIIGLILELAVLGFDLEQDGFTFGGAQNAPVGFFGGDAATCVALLVMIIAAFSGRGWVRAAGTVLLLVNAYNSFQMLSIQLTGSDESRSGFAQPLNHLLLNLDEIAQIGLAVIFTLVVTATVRRNGPTRPTRPAGPAGPAGPAVGFPGTPPGFAPYQQQPGYGPAPAAYAYPPAPPEGPTPS